MITIFRNDRVLFQTEINKDSTFSRQLMSDDYITLKFSLLEPIKFELGDFCDCSLGRYELISSYNPSYNTSKGCYDYQLRLDAEYRKWKNKQFQYRPQYGGLEASWSLTGTIDLFMQVFLSNLSALGYKYKRETDYHVEYSDDVDMEKSYALSFSNVNLIDALSQIAEKWETEWWIDNNIIHIGKCQLGTEETTIDFVQDVNVAKMSSSASQSDYLSRLYVFGSTTNVPARYRKNLEFDVKTTGDKQIYDTARPLALNMFKEVKSDDVALTTFKESKITAAIGVDGAFETNAAVKFSDKGVYTLQNDAVKVSVDLIDPYEEEERFYEIIYDSAYKPLIKSSVGFYFSVDVYITVKATQGEKDSLIGSTTKHIVVNTAFYNRTDTYKNIGTFSLPELKLNDYKNEDIKLSVTVRANITGDMLLHEYVMATPGSAIYKINTNEGATADKFKIDASLSSSTVTIKRQHVDFPIKVLSGTQKDKTDNAIYYEGSETIYLSSLSLALGDRYGITDNIISPKVPAYYFTDDYQSEIVKTGVYERHLMLPLSWNNGHNWIDAEENMSQEEIVDGVLVLDDIYPKAKCTIKKIISYKIEQVDEETNKKTGVYDTYYLIATDDMTLKKEYLLSTESNFKVSFNSGSLNGMVFEFDLKEKGYTFENVVQEDGTLARQTLDRQYFHIFANEDYGRLLPDTILLPKVGDEFYVLNYDAAFFDDMGLTSAAENELLEKGKEYMEKSKIDPNTYTCQQYFWDAKKTGLLSLGQRINLVSSAYFKDGKRASRVIGVEGQLDIPSDNPSYTIGETANYSRLGNIEDKIDEIQLNGSTYINNGGTGRGSSVYLIKSNDSTPASDTNAYSAKRSDENYVSLTNDQTISGNKTFNKITSFLKGITLGTNYSISELGDAFLRVIQGKGYYISEDGDVVFREIASSDYDYAAQSGYGMKRREDGKFKLSLTDLEVWGKAVFHELEIRKLSYVGGNFIFSPAGSTLMHVEEIKTSGLQGQATFITGYKCYFLADNGSTATENMWKVGDLAFSQSFGIKEGVYENVSNRRYWRKVTAVSSENEQITDADGNVLYDGQKFGWITLNNTMPGTGYEAGSDAPSVGDAVCCLGNVSDTERQNAIEIQIVGDLAPAIIQYEGITTFSLTDCVKTQISPKGNKFIGTFYVKSSDDSTPVRVPCDKGEWQNGTKYEYYDRVTHNGSLWLCIAADGTELEPTDENISVWQKQVSKGEDGKQGEKGEQGEQGIAGEGGWSYTMSPATLAFETDKEGNVIISDGTNNFAVIRGYKGTTSVNVQLDKSSLQAYNCIGEVSQSDFTSGSVKIKSINNQTVEDKVIPCSSGHISVKARVYDDEGAFSDWFWVYLYFSVSFATSIAKLEVLTGKIQSSVEELSTNKADATDVEGKYNELTNSISTIEQTAEGISLKVDQQSVRGRNLIPRSYFFSTSRIYGIGYRKFTLEAGKYYSLSVNGHIDTALKNGGGVLRAFIFNSTWTFQKYVDIDSTTDITATLESNDSFTVESTGEYYFQVYPFHPTGKFKGTKPQEDGLITLNWAQLEEGSVCSPWSLNESDPAISGNFLPVLSDEKWTRATGSDIQEGALDTGFRKLQALHYKNTSSSEVDVLYMNDIFAPDSGEVYTLSFWAKGSGTIKSFLYPEACERVADNLGQVGTLEDGFLPHTLTSDWQRIRIAYCIKQLFGNYFYNAGFNAASSYTANWDITGTTRHIGSAVDGWGGQHIVKSSGASYCEISQAVGASLFASWWTITFKAKNPSVMRIYLSGISLDTIDNSGMTVCVDGVDQSVKSDSGVLYVEVAASSTAYTEHSITFKASSALSSARIYFRTYGSYFNIAKPMLTPASQKSGFSTREQGTVRKILPCRLAANSEVWIGGVKLEQGGRMTDYTEDGVSVDELLATGIDITKRQITVTADKFLIRNNKGKETFSVDQDGRVTMINVDFGGMINKQAVDIKQLSDLQSLFEYHYEEFERKNIFYCAKIDKMYGIYNITFDIPAAGYAMNLCLPSLYVDINGDWSAGGISDEFYLADSDVPPEKIMKAVRAMIGNKVVIYNDSTGDVKIQGVTNYMHDVWEKSTSSTSAAKSAAVLVQSSSASTQASTTTAVSTPWTNGSLSSPTFLDTPWNQELGHYLGRERDWGTWTLNGGKHNFVVMECLCEVDIRGNECIYWSVMYGRGMGFK